MKTSSKLCVFFVSAIAVAALVFSSLRFMKASEIGPAAATYQLSDRQLAQLESAALAGDCAAAERIGRHHLFFSLQEDEATKWYRLAAKCPNANAKAQLIALLMDYPKNSAEVDKLLEEISTIDSRIADEARVAVNLGKLEAQSRKAAK
jgi:hypothetical protein